MWRDPRKPGRTDTEIHQSVGLWRLTLPKLPFDEQHDSCTSANRSVDDPHLLIEAVQYDPPSDARGLAQWPSSPGRLPADTRQTAHAYEKRTDERTRIHGRLLFTRHTTVMRVRVTSRNGVQRSRVNLRICGEAAHSTPRAGPRTPRLSDANRQRFTVGIKP